MRHPKTEFWERIAKAEFFFYNQAEELIQRIHSQPTKKLSTTGKKRDKKDG